MSAREFDFEREMKKRCNMVYDRLYSYLPLKDPLRHYKMVRDYPLRKGKGFRASLCLFACEAFGGDPDKAMGTAAAFQASQDWILVHDDIEDGSKLRRKKRTLHRKYGIPLAINAGDSLHVIMWRILQDNKDILGNEMAFKIMGEMTNILMITTEGQYMELAWVRNKRFDITEEEYYEMTRRKTGIYTFVGPCKLGALISEKASREDLDAMEEFGTPAGIAFQIRDDVLNLTGDEEKVGKEIAGDIYEGKRTLILIHLLKKCDDQEKQKVIEIYSKRKKDKTDVKYVWQLMKDYSSIDFAQRRGEALIEKAKRIFHTKFAEKIPESKAKEWLAEALDWVIQRED